MYVNVYDFDGTIYNGDSSVDFYKYCIKKNKRTILNVFPFGISVFLYLIKVKDKEYMKEKFFGFVKYFDDIDLIVDSFWNENDHKIKYFYYKNHKKNDLIISASPEFLLSKISKKLGCNLIASNVDKKTGKFLSKNCHDKQKVIEFEKTNKKINEFYSDSLSDIYLKEISKKAFIVKKDKIYKWDDYKKKKK